MHPKQQLFGFFAAQSRGQSKRLSALTFGLLSALSTTLLSETALAAQLDSLAESVSEVSLFCQWLSTQPPDSSFDLEALATAIEQDSNLNQSCDYFGSQILPLNLLLSLDPVKQSYIQADTALAQRLARQLIERGADVNARDDSGDTPLHAVGSSLENARSLLERGANVNAQNNAGLTPLHNVFGQKSAAVMALLIAQGADVNAATPEEQITPLHLASMGDITALLISRGADVNARSSQNWTPLHYAVSNFKVAAQLIQAGADLTIQNREGAAIHAPDLSPDVLQLLLDAGADVNLRNQEGQTALHKQRFNFELVPLLLTAGADVNIQDNQGRTPLFDVNLKVAEQLVATGADLNIQDNLGRTPLHQAVLEEESYFGPELVELFLSEGADATIKDNQGETALDIARRLDKPNIVSLFPADGGTLVGGETTDSEMADPQLLNEVQRQVEYLTGDSSSDDNYRQQAISRISQAYIGAEQFETAQTFLQPKQVGNEASRLRDIALWAGRSGQLETARAVTHQIPENYRAETLVELAQLYQYQSQLEQAKLLLDEAQQLLSNNDNDWRGSFEMATKVAEAYAELGEAEAARKVLIAAEQAGAVPTDGYPTSDWVSAFAKIGAFDRATQLVDNASAGQRSKNRLSLATVYTDRGNYDQAMTMLSQIPNSALAPYRKSKQKLFERIVKETLKQGNVGTAKRAVKLIENPVDRGSGWLEIASFYRAQQQLRDAIKILDRLVKDEMPNAISLTAIAKEYWAVGQREQAIETAEAALVAIPIFQPDAKVPLYDNNYLGAIAKLGRDWQAPELQAAAVREMETRIEAAASDEQPLLSLNSSYQLSSLVELAYNPNQASSELFNRNLARLETIFEQAPADSRLSVLERMVSLYIDINRLDEARAAIEKMLPLIAALPDESQRVYDYSRLASTTIQTADLEDQFQILPRLSITQRLDVLTGVVKRAAGEDDTARTMQYFDQLIQLSERSQSQSDRDNLLLNFAYIYEDYGHTGGEFSSPPLPRTSAAVALLMRLPQHISDPSQQVALWTTLIRLDLPPAETDKAYEALYAKLKEMPDSYRKRETLWFLLERTLNDRAFERATQIAHQLERGHGRTALGWIETVRQKQES